MGKSPSAPKATDGREGPALRATFSRGEKGKANESRAHVRFSLPDAGVDGAPFCQRIANPFA